MTEANLHVVAGLGPVGRAVIDELLNRGLPVRAITRDHGPDLPVGVEIVHADITDLDAARRAMAGAAVVYHTASAPYHRWPQLLPPLMRGVLEGARATGARIVYADNLYAYGPVDGPLTEELPSRATGPNGRIRATLADQLLEADASGAVRATDRARLGLLRPARPAVNRRRTAVRAGDQRQGHSGLGRSRPAAYVHLPPRLRPRAGDPRNARRRARPGLACPERRNGDHARVRAVGPRSGRKSAELQAMPAALLAAVAFFSPMLRAVREQQYQRTAPWIVDHTKFAQAFGVEVTPHRDAVAVTVTWFAGTMSNGNEDPPQGSAPG